MKNMDNEVVPLKTKRFAMAGSVYRCRVSKNEGTLCFNGGNGIICSQLSAYWDLI